jgi:oligopeptidase B
MINTMLDESLPLTTLEYTEWGNPNIPAEYAYIRSYSPYENLRSGNFPAAYIRSGLHDSQVMFWEQAKFVARLRTLKTTNTPLLLRTDLGAGHGGASGRYDKWREAAEYFAFLLGQLQPTE